MECSVSTEGWMLMLSVSPLESCSSRQIPDLDPVSPPVTTRNPEIG